VRSLANDVETVESSLVLSSSLEQCRTGVSGVCCYDGSSSEIQSRSDWSSSSLRCEQWDSLQSGSIQNIPSHVLMRCFSHTHKLIFSVNVDVQLEVTHRFDLFYIPFNEMFDMLSVSTGRRTVDNITLCVSLANETQWEDWDTVWYDLKPLESRYLWLNKGVLV
jgi:hypothetical protein